MPYLVISPEKKFSIEEAGNLSELKEKCSLELGGIASEDLELEYINESLTEDRFAHMKCSASTYLLKVKENPKTQPWF